MYEAVKTKNIAADNSRAEVKKTDFKNIFFMRFKV